MTFDLPHTNLLPKDGSVYLLPDFFNKDEGGRIYTELLTTVPWRHEPIKMFGKEIMQPRLTAWYGDAGAAYTYSGITMHPLQWNDVLKFIKEKIELQVGHTFNSALLNCYRDGSDSMGWHQDNEKELGKNPVLASVSFGTARIFYMKHIKEDLTVKIPLDNGSLLFMSGETQHHWRHAIPKQKNISGRRINITFRTILANPQ